MDDIRGLPSRLRAAIGISIVLHLCAFAMLACLGRPRRIEPEAFAARPTVFSITTIVRYASPMPIRGTAVRAQPQFKAHPALRAEATNAPIAVRRTARANDGAPRPPRPIVPRHATVALNRFPAAAPAAMSGAVDVRPTVPAAPTGDPADARVETPVPVITPASIATLTPVATPAATPSPAARSGSPQFGGLFSQNYPPALPVASVVADVRARLGGHGRIRIDIDEQGHATGVRILGAGSMDAAASDVRAALLAITYVPADCNGLHCDGILDLIY